MRHHYLSNLMNGLINLVIILALVLAPVQPIVYANTDSSQDEPNLFNEQITEQIDEQDGTQNTEHDNESVDTFKIDPGNETSLLNDDQPLTPDSTGYWIFLPLIMKNSDGSIQYGPDLSITKSDDDLSVHPGDRLIYSLTYQNHSSISATGDRKSVV